MTEPAFVVGQGDRTPGGSLSGPVLEKVAELLYKRRGFVLLPSDTCYSIAALPLSAATRAGINTMLGRPDGIPLSLAFSGLPAADQYIADEAVAKALLKSFCPGPITVVCPGVQDVELLPMGFFDKANNVPDWTIGVRIPDCVIERQVSAATDYPVTTVAVRSAGYADAIRDFDTAHADECGFHVHALASQMSTVEIETILRSITPPFPFIQTARKH